MPAVWGPVIGLHEPRKRIEVQGWFTDPLPRHDGTGNRHGALQGSAAQRGTDGRATARGLGRVGIPASNADDQGNQSTEEQDRRQDAERSEDDGDQDAKPHQQPAGLLQLRPFLGDLLLSNRLICHAVSLAGHSLN